MVNLAGCAPGQFVYGQLASAVTLTANTVYDLMSQEVAGGDQWYELIPVTASGAVTVTSGAVSLNGLGIRR